MQLTAARVAQLGHEGASAFEEGAGWAINAHRVRWTIGTARTTCALHQNGLVGRGFPFFEHKPMVLRTLINAVCWVLVRIAALDVRRIKRNASARDASRNVNIVGFVCGQINGEKESGKTNK
jgi:hypothetical protein